MKLLYILLLLLVMPFGGWAQYQTALDSTFAQQGILRPDSLSVAGSPRILVQSDSRIVSAISYVDLSHPGQVFYKAAIRRFMPDGRPDSTFNDSGIIHIPIPDVTTLAGLAFQQHRKIVALVSTGVYQGNHAQIIRIDSAGHLDTSFNHTGIVTVDHPQNNPFSHDTRFFDLAVGSDDKIWIGGSYDYDFTDIHRYLPDGSIDSAFGYFGQLHTSLEPMRSFSINRILIQPDGMALMIGTSTEIGNNLKSYFTVARYTTDGLLDTGFHFGSGYLSQSFPQQNSCAAYSGLIKATGKIILAGEVNYKNSNAATYLLLQLNANGRIDSTWSTNGRRMIDTMSAAAYYPPAAPQIALQPDGKMLLSLGNKAPNGKSRYALYRLGADGSKDLTFGLNGEVTTAVCDSESSATSLALQVDGKVLLAGTANLSNYQMYTGIVRYRPDVKLKANDYKRNDLDAQVFPNPLTANSIIQYTLKERSTVSINLYAMDGKLLAVIQPQVQQATGTYTKALSVQDGLPAGIYLLSIRAGNSNASVRLIK